MRSIREVLECGSSGVRKLFEYKQNTPVSDDTKGMREERGIALVMTMGILSMLLVLALAFAASARTERKAASAGADVVQARLLAESAVHRIAALAQNYHDIASRTEPATHGTGWGFYNASNDDTRDFIYRLATNDYYGTELLGWSKANTILTANSAITYGKINWEYIIMPVPVNGVNANQIVGRIAYTMIPESGIDPAALVENGANENVVNMEKRFGIHMHEINIASLNDSANTNKLFPDGYVSGYVEKFNYDTGFGGKFDTTAWTGPRPQGIGWPDFTTMFSAARLNVANTDHQMAMKSWFVENPVATDEKFWIDINNDGVQDSNEFHHRFNLARTDWNNLGTLGANSAAAVGIILGTSTPTGAGGAGPWVWTLAGEADGTADNMCDGASIPWLGLANWTDAGTFPDAATRAKQIAANLIDYCDNEVDAGGNPIPIPTSDVAANTWSDASRPTYTGNEKTFYINEAHLLFSCDQEAMPLNDVTGNFLWNSYAASAQLTVEIVDIYNPAVPLPVPNIYASGQLSFKWRRADNSLQTESVTFTDQAVSASVTTVAGFSSASYNIGAWNRGTNAEKVKTDVPPKPPEIIDLSWHITSIIIKDGAGNGVDYARPYAAAGAATTVGSLGTGNDMFYVQVSNQIEDPRQNLNPGDWPAPVVKLDSGGPPGFNYTLRTNNVGANPSVSGKDTETSLDVLNISTAVIANRPMKSPWELGLIHRGAKWETINLKEYNAEEKASLTAGGGAYKNDGSAYNGGDANILDQIKMTRDTQSPMKVSYSVAAANDILYALLDKIKIGSDIKSGVADNIALTGTPITGAGVAKVVGGILNSSADFITRASVANSLTTGNEWALSGGTTVCGVLQDTDAKQEELIGKFINLTTMESVTETSQSDFFNAIVLAQTIKDVGGDGTDITILKDLNNDGQIQGSATVDESTLGYDVDGLHGENSSGFLGGSGEYNDFSAFASGSFSVNEQIGAQLGRYDRYADEITAEQKLKVQLYRHPGTSPTPGKVEIISIEYLD